MSRFHCTTFMTLEILPVILLSGSAGGSDKSGLLIVCGMLRFCLYLSVLDPFSSSLHVGMRNGKAGSCRESNLASSALPLN